MKDKIITSLVLILFGLSALFAQENSTASGGEALGTGGTMSFSLGQVFYITNNDSTGSVAQGLQQPYEISTTLGLNETSYNLEINIFPNPTLDYLTLKVEKIKNLNYILFNIQGKVIENKKITTNNTTIKMRNLPETTYFLKILDNNLKIKTFKIIKN